MISVDVDLGCWMMASVLPRTLTTDMIVTCRFVGPVDKVPVGDADVVVVWVIGFTGSTGGCCPAASSCYVAYSFLQNK